MIIDIHSKLNSNEYNLYVLFLLPSQSPKQFPPVDVNHRAVVMGKAKTREQQTDKNKRAKRYVVNSDKSRTKLVPR